MARVFAHASYGGARLSALPHNTHMVAVGRGPWCGTSAACANSLNRRRARAATAAAAHVLRVIPRHLRFKMTPSEGLRFQCCFCGADITPADEDPLSLTLPVSGGGVQELFCHTACLRSHVHPSVPLALDD